MATIHSHIAHNSGIPLGGIGAGTVEVRPDGLFHEWHMFNCGQWNPGGAKCEQGREAMGPEDLLFMLRVGTADGAVLTRYLALREQLNDMYSLAWMRCVEGITFDGRFPVARLTYLDSDLPVEMEAEVFAPFVPLDSRASGTPGFYVGFTVRNLSDSPVEVSILGVMRNAVGYDQHTRSPHNTLRQLGPGASGEAATAVWLRADGLAEDECSTGDMTFACAGGEITHITGSLSEEHKALTLWKAGAMQAGLKALTFLHQFRDDGRLPNLDAERPTVLPEGFRASDLSPEERERLLRELMQHPWVYDRYHRYCRVDPEMVTGPEFLDGIAQALSEIRDRGIEWGWAALCSRSELAPGAASSALFNVTWFFPNHISPSGANIGHRYEHWFSSSLEVAEHMMTKYPELRRRTLALPEAIHSSSLPSYAASSVTEQMSTLAKCTWWTKAGHFGVWEGYGCCGFHTTDITYQGSFPIISLFPDLQKAQMEHGAAFQREDGRVHHFFTPDFGAVDNGFDRVDMNQQFVMLAARDYLWTGDRGYLDRLWPHIIRAMDNTALLDTDGDGLPDADTRRNTYDAWDFSGCPSYISSLWLGALKAAVRLAEEVGDAERGRAWQSLYEKGVKSFEDRLWNGEYYVLWRDGDTVDECCMSDQMSGDWFSSACGWGPILDTDRIRTALSAIVSYNFREGQGLVNASYPPGKQHRLAASGNFQADAPWTGIEYTVASLLIDYGLVAEGLAIVRDIADRYMRAGRVWSHVECGSHYYRAMSSWTVMLALSGFRWDRPAGSMTFAPAIEEPAGEYPFFAPDGWGVYYQENGVAGTVALVDLNEGSFTVSELRLPQLRGFGNARARLGSEPAACSVGPCGDGVCITFDPPVAITPDTPLAVSA